MGQDLQAMMCADALVLARSTLRYLTGYHSVATRIYGGVGCDGKLGQLASLRPEAQVTRRDERAFLDGVFSPVGSFVETERVAPLTW